MVGAGQMTRARFVGSDRKANITLLKLDKPQGIPVKIAPTRPQEGTLTMFLSPNSGVGRLMIWTNELKDWGVVVNMEGGVYGFARQGQFLSAAGCRSAIDQLIRDGQVRRAQIGLGIVEVPQNDPARDKDVALGTQPAVRVSEIAPHSPAAGAGIKVGDLIVELNDQPVGDPHSYAAAMGEPKSKTSVKVLRAGQTKTVTIDPATDR
jgi:membrane-associated protease RseP (regulator of RpoE activity)